MFDKSLEDSVEYIKVLVTSNKTKMMSFVPLEARSLVSNLLNIEPQKRADHDRLLNGSYFKDPQSKVTEFIELFFSKSEQQQKEFLCLIGKALIRKGDNQG
jgi:serine/threonine protein kinase